MDDKMKIRLKKAYNIGGYVLIMKEYGLKEYELIDNRLDEDIIRETNKDELALLLKLIRNTFYSNEMKVKEFEKIIGL